MSTTILASMSSERKCLQLSARVMEPAHALPGWRNITIYLTFLPLIPPANNSGAKSLNSCRRSFGDPLGPDKGSGMFPYAYYRQSTVPDLGAMAERAGAKHLMLTHLIPAEAVARTRATESAILVNMAVSPLCRDQVPAWSF